MFVCSRARRSSRPALSEFSKASTSVVRGAFASLQSPGSLSSHVHKFILLFGAIALALGFAWWLKAPPWGKQPAREANRPIVRSSEAPEPLGMQPEGERMPRSTEPGGDPWSSSWVQVPRAIQLEGRPLRDIVREWHGDLWPRLVDAYGDDVLGADVLSTASSLEELGDLQACVDEVLPRLLLDQFQSAFKSTYRVKYGSLDHYGDSSAGGEALLKQCVMGESYNPSGRSVDQSGPAWENAVELLETELESLRAMALTCAEEAVLALERDLSGLSLSHPPARGKLLVGPYWGPPHPDFDQSSFVAGRHIMLGVADYGSPCKNYMAGYTLDLLEDESMASLLALLEDEKVRIRLVVRDLINSLPGPR
jgi:hypothetical protein